MLALAKASAPAVVGELALPGQPAPDSHTGALLADLAQRRLGKPATWLRVRVSDGAITPRVSLVYLQVNAGATIEKPVADALRAHVAGGGTVLVQPAGGEAALAKKVIETLQAATADMGFETAELANDHALYTAGRRVGGDDRPKFIGIGDTIRTSILIARGDFRS
ncbi:MAG: hypothetical protein NT031_13965, partial [Planctomycetota bacterium]|nr:hypothetical protein [Planctomycetota bacterium]